MRARRLAGPLLSILAKAEVRGAAVHAFDVLGDPVRRRILELLAGGERTAGRLTEVIREEFGITQAGVSQHLRAFIQWIRGRFRRPTPGSASFADFGSSAFMPSRARLPGERQGAAKTIGLDRLAFLPLTKPVAVSPLYSRSRFFGQQPSYRRRLAHVDKQSKRHCA
jgi:DNA-binding transcriptional ArsR family regulator